jgi:hypothetical protein
MTAMPPTSGWWVQSLQDQGQRRGREGPLVNGGTVWPPGNAGPGSPVLPIVSREVRDMSFKNGTSPIFLSF